MSEITTPSNVKQHSTTNTDQHIGKYVKLNVGNSLFLTSVEILTKHDTMFKAMFSGRMEVVQDREGTSIYILYLI
jgi:hypothetical protein